jgi:hypothetical protein
MTMSARRKHNGTHDPRYRRPTDAGGTTADRRLVFVRDAVQWERDRTRIMLQLACHGFPLRDRICVSIALDEAVTNATGEWPGGAGLAAMVGYSVSARAFHMHVRRVAAGAGLREDPEADDHERNRWLLLSACMTDVRLSCAGNKIDMWKHNSAGAS